jgi:hypothetical protein
MQIRFFAKSPSVFVGVRAKIVWGSKGLAHGFYLTTNVPSRGFPLPEIVMEAELDV